MKGLIDESEKKKKEAIDETDDKDKADILTESLDNISIEDIKKSIENDVPTRRASEAASEADATTVLDATTMP
jgi:hypothetical protein